MELAKAWFRPGVLTVPDEFQVLLGSNSRLDGLQLVSGTPELVTPLPERGEGRNHDLALVGETPREKVTICVEAKADEPFGDKSVGEYLVRAPSRREKTNRPSARLLLRTSTKAAPRCSTAS